MKTEVLIFVCLSIFGIQDSCSGRHIGHEIIQVTQHTPSPRSKRDVGIGVKPLVAEDFPKHMQFTLHLKDSDKTLILNKQLSPHDVIVTNNDGVVKFDPQQTQYAVYQDIDSHAVMIVECSQLSEICTLEGTFYHKLSKWNLNPIKDLKGKYNATESLDTFATSQIAHSSSKKNPSVTIKRDAEHLYLQLLKQLRKEGHTTRQKRQTDDCNIVEVEILTDSSVFEYFESGEAGYELAGGAVLLKHYLALFGEFDLRYKCLIEYGICIRIFLNRVRVNTNPGSDWTNTFLGNGNVDGLQTLLNCGTQRDGQTTADVLVCTTRLNIEFQSDPSFRSISFFGTLCQSQFGDFRALISEDLGDDTDLVFASSLLGLFNVTLDSADLDPSCNSSFLFIGTQFDDAPHANDTLTNPWKFSNCSRVQLQRWIDFLDSGTNCLKSSSITVEDYDTYLDQTPFAGEIFDLDFQCQNTYGLDSFATIGPGETSVYDVGDICWKGVYCDVGGDNSYRTRVYNGSPCGCKKICVKNECVREFNIPLGEACEGCCECADHNAICDCETKTCVCDEGFCDDNGDLANGTCVPVEPPGGSCASNDCCSDENSICNASQICVCKDGWILRDGVCVRFCDNDSLPSVANGVYLPQDNVEGSIANLECNMGYTPNSIDTCSVCEDDGWFSTPTAYCIRDCGCPPVAHNGDYILKEEDNTTVGSEAHLYCCDGYSTESTVTITCKDTAQGWSTPSENCTINDCGSSLPYVTYGEYVANHGTIVGSIGTLHCGYGYVPKSDDDCIVCLSNGNWSEPKTYCIRDCGCPPVAYNGDYRLKVENDTLAGSKAILYCCDGYSTESTVMITCEDTAWGWSYPDENCTINDCGSSLPYVTNGTYVANHGTTVGSIGTLQCDYGYVPMSDDDCIVCLFNGNWSEPKTYCIRDCGCPPLALNGDYKLIGEETTILEGRAVLKCCEGYSTSSTVKITCEDTAQGWSDPSETCLINDCGKSLPYVTNGRYVANHGTTVGSIGTLQCDDGNVPKSDDDCISCLFNGSWSEPKTYCIRDCGPTPVPFGGRYELNDPGNTTLGATARLICCDVCDLGETVTITCEDTEQGWSDPAKNCTINDCGPTFPNVTNGAYQVSGTLIGSFGQLVCDNGYTPNATEICIVCLPSGVWTDPGTGCIRDCGIPPLAENGDFVLNEMETTTLGAMATLTCCNGYSTGMNVSITCEDKGWSTPSENCTINDCGSSLSYVTYGEYVANNGTTVGSIGTLHCDYGYYCGSSLPNVQNGIYSARRETTVGSIGNLICDDGYTPASNDDCIVCLLNGTWSEPNNWCVRDCGPPPRPQNGYYDSRATWLGSGAVLICCEGYSTDNLVWIVCEDTREGWSAPDDNCTINDCGSSLPSIANGRYEAKNGTVVGSVGALQCEDGYVPESSESCIVCLFNGSWSEPLTTCKRDCGVPPKALNGEYCLDLWDGTCLGDTATLDCDDGFSTRIPVTLTCDYTGWTDPIDRCTINDCGSSLPNVTNGAYMAKDGTTVHAIATLQCDFGYVPVSCDTCIICESNGSWSDPQTTCIRDCGIPPKALYGEYYLDVKESTTLGATASLECDEGFSTESLVTIMCEDNPAGWSDPTDTCEINDCGSSLPWVMNGMYVANEGTTVASIATLECEDGYVPYSCDICIVCLFNGSWSEPNATCVRDCGPPPHKDNGKFKLTEDDCTLYGNSAYLSCDYGYQSSYYPDPVYITCEDTAAGWSAHPATCDLRDCGTPLPYDPNGWFQPIDGTWVGYLATLHCDDGYSPKDCDISVVCTWNGTWSAPLTYCVRDCGPPPHISHGQFKLDRFEYTIAGSTALMSCDAGFWNSLGDVDVWIVCEDNLTGWSTTVATCEISVCADAGLPSVPNGAYESQGNEVGSSAILVCEGDFIPYPCDTCSVCQMDGTWSNPNASCVNKLGLGEKCYPGECANNLVCNPVSYTCACPKGFVQNGTNCEIECPTSDFVQFGTSCYLFGTTNVFYKAARAICDGFDTDVLDCRLVQIDTSEELTFVKDFMTNRALEPTVGYWNDVFQFGNNSESERWRTTGDTLVVTDWDTTAPQPDDNGGGTDEFCTVFDKANQYKWFDVECENDLRSGSDSTPYFTLCEIDYAGADHPSDFFG